MNNNILIIGIDGGATKVSAWEVQYDETSDIFSMGTANAQRSYRDIPGYISDFTPVPVAEQLKQRDENTINPTTDEQQQETVYVEACAQVIEKIAQQTSKKVIIVGLGMPGLKTEDKRGIAVVANGPRMLRYSDLLEERLKLSDIQFAAPIHHLGSDADYCGIGENFSAEGRFRDVQNAYYLGGGTGVADALKLNGSLVPFDETKEWMAKSWEMKSSDGRSLERFASAGGIQSIYADLSGRSVEELNAEGLYPLQMAERIDQGDTTSAQTFKLVVEELAQLLFERITTLYAGWQENFEFMNPNRPALSSEHPFKGGLFQRIILGQRLGDLADSTHGKTYLFKPLLSRLQQLISDSAHLGNSAKAHYSSLESILVTSLLREAPALGAGIDAFTHYNGRS